jgi:hypothetical protein
MISESRSHVSVTVWSFVSGHSNVFASACISVGGRELRVPPFLEQAVSFRQFAALQGQVMSQHCTRCAYYTCGCDSIHVWYCVFEIPPLVIQLLATSAFGRAGSIGHG